MTNIACPKGYTHKQILLFAIQAIYLFNLLAINYLCS